MKLSEINLDELLNIAVRAGEEIMKIRETLFEVSAKIDGSPLTLADQRSNEIINNYLLKTYSIPILSEENESVPYKIRNNWSQYWLIDPLDGTKEFIHKRREFTVNIALVEDNRPVLGVIYAPVFKDMYYAVKGKGCYFNYRDQTILLHSESRLEFKNQVLKNQENNHIKLILSRSHNDGFELNRYLVPNQFSIQTIAMGSSLKFCRIAHGLVDANIRMKPTMEWDTAAAQIILEEAGRKLIKYEDGAPLEYNKEDLMNPYFIAL